MGLQRLLVASTSTALDVAAAQLPQLHTILMIVNSTVYGGSGGAIAVFSMAPGAVQVALHEIGHTAFNSRMSMIVTRALASTPIRTTTHSWSPMSPM